MFTWSRRSKQNFPARFRKCGIGCAKQKPNSIHQKTHARQIDHQTDHPHSWHRQWGCGNSGAHKLIPMPLENSCAPALPPLVYVSHERARGFLPIIAGRFAPQHQRGEPLYPLKDRPVQLAPVAERPPLGRLTRKALVVADQGLAQQAARSNESKLARVSGTRLTGTFSTQNIRVVACLDR